jgi:hypothetical protein
MTVVSDALIRPGVPLRIQVICTPAPDRTTTVSATLDSGSTAAGATVIWPAATPEVALAVVPDAGITVARLAVRLARLGGEPALVVLPLVSAVPSNAWHADQESADPIDGRLWAWRRREIAALEALAPMPLWAWSRHQALLASADAPSAMPGAGATILRGFACPCDGSVLPVRIHLPSGPARASVILAWSPPRHGLLDWSPIPASWRQAADRAGVVVVEPHVAGDPSWRGLASRRCAALWPTLMAETGLGLVGPPVVLAVGPLMVGAARAAARLGVQGIPARVALAERPEALADPVVWTGILNAASPPPDLDPEAVLSAYADGPFVVVVGTGEHEAARDDQLKLARRFVEDWYRQSYALPPVVLDGEFESRRWQQHRLVLVGNPRSHRLIADQACQDAGLRWDHRQVMRLDADGRVVERWHRSTLPGIAVSIADPRGRPFPALVIDGSAVWTGGLPFHDAGDAQVIVRGVASGSHEP